MTVTVVTDSTAALPPELAGTSAIHTVPLYYAFAGEEPIAEGSLGDLAAFHERLDRAESLPVTSPPRVEDFVAAYRRLLERGDEIVSVHISSGISETCAVARRAVEELAAEGARERVRVVDSASATGSVGLLALAAARAAAKGADLEGVEERVRQVRPAVRVWFTLDTLDYLRRGGRVGSAAAWIGSTLQVKPILTVESEIKAVERVRTRARALERLVEYADQLRAAGSDGWALVHTHAEAEAAELRDRLQQVFWRPPVFVAELGEVISTHVGPGLLGFGGIPGRFLE